MAHKKQTFSEFLFKVVVSLFFYCQLLQFKDGEMLQMFLQSGSSPWRRNLLQRVSSATMMKFASSYPGHFRI